MPQDLITARCDGCGQADTDPKLHYGDRETYHHDCVPARVLDDLTSITVYEGGNVLSRERLDEKDLHPHTLRTLRVIEAAKGGTRGEKLRAHIAKLHDDAQEG
jgi:hypothetical protein